MRKKIEQQIIKVSAKINKEKNKKNERNLKLQDIVKTKNINHNYHD